MAERGVPALQSFIESFVGGKYVVAFTQVNVATTATKILQNDFERMSAIIINTGANSCLIAPQNTVSTTNGIVMGALGGNVSMSANEDLALVGWEWWGIGSGGSTTVTVMTITRYVESAS